MPHSYFMKAQTYHFRVYFYGFISVLIPSDTLTIKATRLNFPLASGHSQINGHVVLNYQLSLFGEKISQSPQQFIYNLASFAEFWKSCESTNGRVHKRSVFDSPWSSHISILVFNWELKTVWKVYFSNRRLF